MKTVKEVPPAPVAVGCSQDRPCQSSNSECVSGECVCRRGYSRDRDDDCRDVDECVEEGKSPCGENGLCTNLDGSFLCNCPSGYTGDPFKSCEDIDECSRLYGPYGQCGSGAVCENTLGSFGCSCPHGFTGDPRHSCSDIDECSSLYPKCPSSSLCTNTLGSFTCLCPPGTSGDPFIQCTSLTPSDPCLNTFCGDHARCQIDPFGQPTCLCDPGFISKSDKTPGCVGMCFL